MGRTRTVPRLRWTIWNGDHSGVLQKPGLVERDCSVPAHGTAEAPGIAAKGGRKRVRLARILRVVKAAAAMPASLRGAATGLGRVDLL